MSDRRPLLGAVQNVLETLSRHFGAIGALDKLNSTSVSDCDAYFARREMTAQQGLAGEVVLVPTSPTCTSSSILQLGQEIVSASCLENLWLVVVDVFENFSGNLWPDAAAKGTSIEVMNPDTFWLRLTGIKRYWNAVLLADEEIPRSRNEFVARGLTYSWTPRSVGDYEAENPAPQRILPALDELVRWAGASGPEEPRGLLVVGERGAGKTWLLKRFQDAVMQRHLESPWLCPAAAYVSLREYGEYLRHRQGARRALSHYLIETCGLRPLGGVATLESLLSAGRILLLLDGIDELSRGAPALTFGEHVAHLLDHLPGMTRSIVTTRSSKFASPSDLRSRLVTGFSTISPQPLDTSEPRLLQSAEEVVYRPALKPCRLLPFTEEDVATLLTRIAKVSGDDLSHSRVLDVKPRSVRDELFSRYGATDWDQTTMIPALMEVATIPASTRSLVGWLCEDVEAGGLSALTLLESVILHPLLAFNLEAGRAADEVQVYPAGGGAHASPATMVLDLRVRLRVLEKVSGHLLEQGFADFDEAVLETSLSEVLGPTVEVVTSDLRAQTVLMFAEEDSGRSRLTFRTPAIAAYFLARHIFRALNDPETRARGLQYLGRYSARPGEERGHPLRTAVGFLQAFLTEGMIDFADGEFEFLGPKKHDRLHVDAATIKDSVLSFVKESGAYSVWTRFLEYNLGLLGMSLSLVAPYDEWKRSKVRSYATDLVLVPGGDELPPFLVGVHEVTNSDYQRFLRSDLVPILADPHPSSGVREVKLVRRRDDHDERNHPLSWHAIHRRSPLPTGGDKGRRRDFRSFTNAYHLFEWLDGDCPTCLRNHPLVWPSFYVAAIFCNWRTAIEIDQENVAALEPVYEISATSDGSPSVSMRDRATGYRVPTVAEWLHAARGGDRRNYPWDSLLCSSNPMRQKDGERLRATLLRPISGTRDVLTSRTNEYGIFGMIGNVREWAWEIEASRKNVARIMGATWALGEESFAYGFPGSPLPMGNTNLDVGFRVARYLDQPASEAVQAARKAQHLAVNEPDPAFDGEAK